MSRERPGSQNSGTGLPLAPREVPVVCIFHRYCLSEHAIIGFPFSMSTVCRFLYIDTSGGVTLLTHHSPVSMFVSSSYSHALILYGTGHIATLITVVPRVNELHSVVERANKISANMPRLERALVD